MSSGRSRSVSEETSHWRASLCQGHPLYHNRGSLVRDPGAAPGLRSLSTSGAVPRWQKESYAAENTKSNRAPATPTSGVTAGQPPRVGVETTLAHELDP